MFACNCLVKKKHIQLIQCKMNMGLGDQQRVVPKSDEVNIPTQLNSCHRVSHF